MTPTRQTAKAAERDLVLTRVLDAPRELVWKVCTEREHALQWTECFDRLERCL